jgi:hypothetical protein
MLPHYADRIFLVCLIAVFVALAVSVFTRKIGLWLLQGTISALGALYVYCTFNRTLFAAGMGNAFGPSQTGLVIFIIPAAVFLAYYVFSVVTCFSRLPNRWLILVAHFIVAPAVALFQFSGLFASGYFGYRLLNMLCFVLIWFRIYELRKQPFDNKREGH